LNGDPDQLDGLEDELIDKGEPENVIRRIYVRGKNKAPFLFEIVQNQYMEANQLLNGEQIITESDDKSITLTSFRIRRNVSGGGQAHIVSIMLEKVSSIEVHYSSWIILLGLGILFGLAGLFAGANNKGDVMVPALLIGGVLVIAYFMTRKHVVTVASDGGAKINFQTRGMKRDAIIEFINKIERAKKEVTK